MQEVQDAYGKKRMVLWEAQDAIYTKNMMLYIWGKQDATMGSTGCYTQEEQDATNRLSHGVAGAHD